MSSYDSVCSSDHSSLNSVPKSTPTSSLLKSTSQADPILYSGVAGGEGVLNKLDLCESHKTALKTDATIRKILNEALDQNFNEILEKGLGGKQLRVFFVINGGEEGFHIFEEGKFNEISGNNSIWCENPEMYRAAMKATNKIYRSCQHGDECSSFADPKEAEIDQLKTKIAALTAKHKLEDFDVGLLESELDLRHQEIQDLKDQLAIATANLTLAKADKENLIPKTERRRQLDAEVAKDQALAERDSILKDLVLAESRNRKLQEQLQEQLQAKSPAVLSVLPKTAMRSVGVETETSTQQKYFVDVATEPRSPVRQSSISSQTEAAPPLAKNQAPKNPRPSASEAAKAGAASQIAVAGAASPNPHKLATVISGERDPTMTNIFHQLQLLREKQGTDRSAATPSGSDSKKEVIQAKPIPLPAPAVAKPLLDDDALERLRTHATQPQGLLSDIRKGKALRKVTASGGATPAATAPADPAPPGDKEAKSKNEKDGQDFTAQFEAMQKVMSKRGITNNVTVFDKTENDWETE